MGCGGSKAQGHEQANGNKASKNAPAKASAGPAKTEEEHSSSPAVNGQKPAAATNGAPQPAADGDDEAAQAEAAPAEATPAEDNATPEPAAEPAASASAVNLGGEEEAAAAEKAATPEPAPEN